MAVTVNESSVAAEPVSPGVTRQPLMTTASNRNTSVQCAHCNERQTQIQSKSRCHWANPGLLSDHICEALR